MAKNSQWQAFVETGDIHHYLRYKATLAQVGTSTPSQKELADGRNGDSSVGTTGSQI